MQKIVYNCIKDLLIEVSVRLCGKVEFSYQKIEENFIKITFTQ